MPKKLLDIPKGLNAVIKKLNWARIGRFAFHFYVALAFGITSVLFFYTSDMPEILPSYLVAAFAIAIICSVLIFGLSYAVLRKWSTAAVLTASVSIIFFNYHYLFDLWGKEFPKLHHDLPFMLLLLAVWAAIAFFLRRSQESIRVRNLEVFVCLISGIFIAINLYDIGIFWRHNWGIKVTADNADMKAAAATAQAADKPDIYYIMPDDYVGDPGLKDVYGTNNDQFYQDLKNMGFYVLRNGYSNYPITTSSLASSFNGGLLQTQGDYKQATSRELLYNLISHPEVAQFLKQQGYQFINQGSWWSATQTSAYADQNIQYAWNVTLFGKTFYLDEFSGFFFDDSMLKPIFEQRWQIRGLRLVNWVGDLGSKPIFLAQASDLESLAKEQSGPPRFVFSHLLSPHEPIVFNSEGGDPDPNLPLNEQYVEQVQFVDKQLENIVQSIQSTPRGKKAIIVMASDEGQFPDNQTASGSNAELRQKTSIFASIYFPDHDYSTLYPTITPANYFRVVFNKYFHTDLKLQPDNTYIFTRDPKYLLDLTNVTDRVRSSGSGG